MREMEAKTDAFAALKGTLKNGAGRRVEGLPRVRRDRQAAVPAVPLPATAARRRHARPGRGRALSARRRAVLEVRHRDRLVLAGAADGAAADDAALDRADTGAGAVSLSDPRGLPPRGARARREGRAVAVARRPLQRHAARGLCRAEHVGHQVPDRHAGRRPERHAVAGQLLRAARRTTATRPTAPRRRRPTSAPTRRRLIPTPRCTTACCSATGSWRRRATSPTTLDAALRQRRGAAPGRRDAGRGHARRRRAAAALPAAAQEAARPARPTIRTTARCRSSRATRPTPTPPPAS